MLYRAYQVRILDVFEHRYIVDFNVKILIHALECALNRDVILQLDVHLGVDQSFEEASISVNVSSDNPFGMDEAIGYLKKSMIVERLEETLSVETRSMLVA